MGVPRTPGGGDIYRTQLYSESSAPQPQLLFGSGPPNRLGHSIWSPSLDDQSLKFVGAGNSYHSPPQYSSTSSQGLSQSKWYPNPSQSSQGHLSGAIQSASFAPPSHNIAGGHHPSSSSSSISVAQLFASQQPNSHAPFRYPITSQQPLLQPVGTHQTQPPMHPYADSVINPNLGAGMHYGHGAIRDYHGNYLDHNHTPGVGQAPPPPPLSQVWGGNVG
jgi:protein SMG7